MAKARANTPLNQEQAENRFISNNTDFKRARLWIVGTTPLITHAWSQKAKDEMLSKQIKKTKPGREQRNPENDFSDSLYEIGTRDGNMVYGFPSTGVKNALLSVAHKDKGIAKAMVMQSLWIDAEIISVRPALAGAVCDMPLLRIFGSEPQMREDMVKIGVGLSKTANLAYRAQFKTWAMQVKLRYNPTNLTLEALGQLFSWAGMSTGIGEWRNERKGVFGAFRLATHEETQQWQDYATGKGPLPKMASFDDIVDEDSELIAA